jgi:hypothetical protein
MGFNANFAQTVHKTVGSATQLVVKGTSDFDGNTVTSLFVAAANCPEGEGMPTVELVPDRKALSAWEAVFPDASIFEGMDEALFVGVAMLAGSDIPFVWRNTLKLPAH